MPDREGGLWLALGVGAGAGRGAVAAFRSSARPTACGPRRSDLRRHDGRLYIAHGQGVQYLRAARRSGLPSCSVTRRGQPVLGVHRVRRIPTAEPPQLLLAASDGLYRIDGGSRDADRRID